MRTGTPRPLGRWWRCVWTLSRSRWRAEEPRYWTRARKCGGTSCPPSPADEPRPKPGPTVALQIVPAEVLLHPAEKVRPIVRGIDANGFVTTTYSPDRVKWAKYIPPTARVRAEMDAQFDAQGELVAGQPSAGAFQATVDGFTGTFRGRILPSLPMSENFEGFQLSVPH